MKKETMNKIEVAVEELLFDVTVAPAVALAVTTPSPTLPSPVERAFGEVSVNLLHGDCLAMMKTLPSDSVDSVVTDPPYGLANFPADLITKTMLKWASGDLEFIPEGKGFMGKSWDGFVPPPAVWLEVKRVLKPGGHVLAFAGSRTQDLMGMSMRLAGLEIKDSIFWAYGTGFPKSMSIDKAIDKAAGATREVVGVREDFAARANKKERIGDWKDKAGLNAPETIGLITAPATDEAKQWEGWGTALKPAHEPILVARKPLSEKTIAGNVLKHGTGGLNIDGSRVGTSGGRTVHTSSAGDSRDRWDGNTATGEVTDNGGRFPANLILDEFSAGLLDSQSGFSKSPAVGSVSNTKAAPNAGYGLGVDKKDKVTANGHGDQGGASRFFKVIEGQLDEAPSFYYSAKAGKAERPVVNGVAHPTVKPVKLMAYLVKLVTPVGGVVLEPFAGSGTTVEACIVEGFDVIAIEREADYIPLIEARVARQVNGGLS